MFQIHFRDYGIANTKYVYIRLKGSSTVNQLHVATLRMQFSSIDDKLLKIQILEHHLITYPELHRAINETLLPLLVKAHKSNVENIISIFMIIYDEGLE